MDSDHGRVPNDKKEGGVGGYTCGLTSFSIFKLKTLMVCSFTLFCNLLLSFGIAATAPLIMSAILLYLLHNVM